MLSEAKQTLVDLGLTVETVQDDESKEPKDTVLGMSPLQYGKVDAGSVVTLTVSSGLGDENTVNIFVDLPSDVEDSVDMTVRLIPVIQRHLFRNITRPILLNSRAQALQL